jgi:hypothetical protein
MLRTHLRIFLVIFLAGCLLLSGALIVRSRGKHNTISDTYVNAVLAARGFRHTASTVLLGESKPYTIHIGEELKITWKTEHLSEDGQLLYRGPDGIGTGLVAIPLHNMASQSEAPFLIFTPKKAGTAAFVLTVTGPGPEGIYTIPTALIVGIIP